MQRLRALQRLAPGLEQPWGAAAARSMAAQPAPAPVDDGMIEVFVNGAPTRVAKGSNVYQACAAAGVDIPRCVVCRWRALPLRAREGALKGRWGVDPRAAFGSRRAALAGSASHRGGGREGGGGGRRAAQRRPARSARAASCPPRTLPHFDRAASRLPSPARALAHPPPAARPHPSTLRSFCYHERLSIAGNCRMCLVEVEKGPPKPVASCAMPAGPGMSIKTDSPMVKKAREGVMEFLLANHPLDCPICDQGGECDLQDQAMAFGSDRGRFAEPKRAVADKNLGPLVKTVMTRCIHCTRCVRFATEVAGVPELGVTGRGRDSEVGTYVDKLLSSELSGNVIDLCPVGALTSKPGSFTYRAWELRPTESVDVSDALGAAIRVDARGTEVVRVTPRTHEALNQEWLSDKGRFSYDGLRYQRLAAPMVKNAATGVLEVATWPEALAAAAAALSAARGAGVRAVSGRLADAEALVALKDLVNRLGSGDTRCEAGYGAAVSADARGGYVFNASVAGIDAADAILLVGTNPRVEAPVLNARLRAAAVSNGAAVGAVGAPADLSFPHERLGEGLAALRALPPAFAARLAAATRPMVIVGSGALAAPDAGAVVAAAAALARVGAPGTAPGWNGFCVLHDAAGAPAALDLGFVPGAAARARDAAGARPSVVYLLGADDVDPALVPDDAFVVYQGHHGDAGAARADVVLPGAAWAEKDATYVNTEGRAQRGRAAVPPPAGARADWAVLRALSEVAGAPLPYDDLAGVRRRLAEVAPHLGRAGAREPALWLPAALGGGAGAAAAAAAGAGAGAPLATRVAEFYQTDAISRASRTMAACVRARAAVSGRTQGAGQ
jgi:NADH dehydrogenase (ubiquinone) Fe-S protein 1